MRLSADIDFLKGSLDFFTKRQWSELFATRVRAWTQRFSLKQLASGTRVLKVLLPDHSADLETAAQTIDGFANILDEHNVKPAGEPTTQVEKS